MVIEKFKTPSLGDRCIKTFFALWPVTANIDNEGNKETRWLEKVTVVYVYKRSYSLRYFDWVIDKFIPYEEDKYIPFF